MTLDNSEVTRFKFKVSGKQTKTIKGKTLKDASKAYIKNVSAGGIVQFFDVRDSKGIVHPQVIIEIPDKLVGAKEN